MAGGSLILVFGSAERESSGANKRGPNRAAADNLRMPRLKSRRYTGTSSSRILTRGSYVLGLAIAERPVLLRHFDQIDKDIFPAQLQGLMHAVRNGLVEALFRFNGAAAVQSDLYKNTVVRSMDTEIIPVKLQTSLGMF